MSQSSVGLGRNTLTRKIQEVDLEDKDRAERQETEES